MPQDYRLTFKILPPHLTEVLERPRLIHYLEQNRDKKLTLILGQAAQGKSTLAASYVKKCGIPTAWINLEPEDSDAANLYGLLRHSLNHALQPTTEDMAFPNCLGASVGPRHEDLIYREWVSCLLEPLSIPLQIVLDGADQLPADASSFRLIQILLDQLPKHIHLMVITRESPPIDVSGLKMRQEACVLNNDALAFTLSEAQRFFREIRNIPLSSEEIHKFHQVTEGWVGGLILLAESLGHLPEEKAAESIIHLLPDHFQKEVFQYFGERVFASLSADIQGFLVQSSVLNVIEPDIAGELTGEDQIAKILDTLARRNLFIQSTYDREKGWLFQYHRLFREFLRARAKKVLNRKSRESLLLKAGALYEKHDRLEDAVRLYLEGKAFSQAVPVIRKIGLRLLAEGRHGELSRWFGALPAELIQDDGWMLLYRCMCNRFSKVLEYASDLIHAYKLCEQAGDTGCLLLCLAHLIEASVTRGYVDIPPIDRLMSQAESLQKTSASTRYIYERAFLFLQMGFGYLLKLGDPRSGIRACQNAYFLSKDSGNPALQINALINVYFCHAIVGDLGHAGKVMKQVDTLLARCCSSELNALHLIDSAQVSWFEGRLEKMGQCIQRAREEIERHGIHYLLLVCMLYELCYARQAGMCEQAAELGENLSRLALAAGNLWMYGNAMLQTGIAYYFIGQGAKAAERCDQARKTLSSPENRSDLHLHSASVVRVLASYRFQTNPDAVMGLAQAIGDWQQKGIHILLKEACLAMALLKWHQGKREEAAIALETGFDLARTRGFHLNLLLNREDMLRVFILALELGLENQWDYAARCLAEDLGDLAGPELIRLTGHENPKIAGRAQAIRVAIHRHRAGRLRIETLGRFRIWRGDTILEEAAWTANQPRLLLKALIAFGCRNVPKDILIENLWPEISTAEGDRNFRVILHRLRKTLEPSMDRKFGSSYVRLRANRVSLDESLCSVDVETFLSVGGQARKMEIGGDFQKALKLYKQAVQLYTGEFLAEELYQPWADSKRKALQRQYVDMLFRAAAIHERQGKARKTIEAYRKIVATDPLEEKASQRLMTLYCELGMRNEALKVYETLHRELQEGLGSVPDELTVAIHREIAESIHRPNPAKAKS